MKITPSFTHPQAILGVYDFLLSDEHNLRYINKYPDASELYNGNEWYQPVKKKSIFNKCNDSHSSKSLRNLLRLPYSTYGKSLTDAIPVSFFP